MKYEDEKDEEKKKLSGVAEALVKECRDRWDEKNKDKKKN